MVTTQTLLRWGTIILLFIILGLASTPSYADDLGPDNSGCVGGGCPSSFPQGPAVYGTVQGRDEAFNVLIGGNWTLGNGASEGEGRIVVLGDVNMNKTSGDINTGFVGAGTWVIPPNDSTSLIIGNNVNFNGNNGDNIIYGGFAGSSLPMRVVYKGTLTSLNGGNFEDGSFPQTGMVTNNLALDLTPYQDIFTSAHGRSQCWNGLPNSANIQFTDGFGTYTIESLNGASGLYVLNLDQNLDPGFSGSLVFTNFPDDATILINMLGTTPSFNISSVTINGTSMNTGSFTAEPVAERILWNFPNATDITLNGASQFWGSIFAPQANMLVGTSTNGRILVGGNLAQGTVSGVGLELHNSPFNGSLPGCDWGDLPDTAVGIGIGNYQTTNDDGGPSHIVTSTSPRLGACVDAESNGQPNTTAVDDNTNVTDLTDTTGIDASHVNVNGVCGAGGDEDGVAIGNGSGAGGQWQDGANGGSVNVLGSNNACLNGWIDWNNDGDFNDLNEQVATDFVLTGVGQTVAFTIPAGTFSNNGADPNVAFYARWRITAACGTSDYVDPTTGTAVSPTPNGPATNGEVEDYVWSFEPTAVTTSHIAASESTHNTWFPILTMLLLAATIFALSPNHRR